MDHEELQDLVTELAADVKSLRAGRDGVTRRIKKLEADVLRLQRSAGGRKGAPATENDARTPVDILREVPIALTRRPDGGLDVDLTIAAWEIRPRAKAMILWLKLQPILEALPPDSGWEAGLLMRRGSIRGFSVTPAAGRWDVTPELSPERLLQFLAGEAPLPSRVLEDDDAWRAATPEQHEAMRRLQFPGDPADRAYWDAVTLGIAQPVMTNQVAWEIITREGEPPREWPATTEAYFAADVPELPAVVEGTIAGDGAGDVLPDAPPAADVPADPGVGDDALAGPPITPPAPAATRPGVTRL